MSRHQNIVHGLTRIHNKQIVDTYTNNDATQQPTNLPTQTAPFSPTSFQANMHQLTSLQTTAVLCAFDTLAPTTNSNLSPHSSQATMHTLNNDSNDNDVDEINNHNTPTLPNNSQPIEKISDYKESKKDVNQKTIYQCGVQDCSKIGTPAELTAHHFDQHTHIEYNTAKHRLSILYYACKICIEKDHHYNHKSKYAEHIRTQHSYDKPFNCPTCLYCATTTDHVTKHRKKQHQLQQPISRVKKNNISTSTQSNSNTTNSASNTPPVPAPTNNTQTSYHSSYYAPFQPIKHLLAPQNQYLPKPIHSTNHTTMPATPIEKPIDTLQTSDHEWEEISEIDENMQNDDQSSSFEPKRMKYEDSTDNGN